MKQFIILLICVVIIVSFGVYEGRYLKETSNYLLADLESAKNYYINGNKVEGEKIVKDISQNWKNIKKVWAIYIVHEELDDIEQRLISLEVYMANDERSEVLNEYENLHSNISHVVESQKLLLHNIF